MKRLIAVILGGALILSGCSTGTPLENTQATGTISVGSANFPESEIVAEIFAQSLEANGLKVKRQMQIGSREIFLRALQDGSIDLVPEYSGNLLRYFDKNTKATSTDQIMTELAYALPLSLRPLRQAAAQNQDAYQVTKEFSAKHEVTSLTDLNKVGKIRLGGAPELAQRPYGPKGLAEKYGVDPANIEFVPLSDKGGPLTLNALLNGDVDIVDIFSTTPAVAKNGLVTLTDPKGLISAQNLLPLLSARVTDDKVRTILDTVTNKINTKDLMDLNMKYQGSDKPSAAAVAKIWLDQHR